VSETPSRTALIRVVFTETREWTETVAVPDDVATDEVEAWADSWSHQAAVPLDCIAVEDIEAHVVKITGLWPGTAPDPAAHIAAARAALDRRED